MTVLTLKASVFSAGVKVYALLIVKVPVVVYAVTAV